MSCLLAFCIGVVAGIGATCLMLSPKLLQKYERVNDSLSQNYNAMKAAKEAYLEDWEREDAEVETDEQSDISVLPINQNILDIMGETDPAKLTMQVEEFASVFLRTYNHKYTNPADALFFGRAGSANSFIKTGEIIPNLLEDEKNTFKPNTPEKSLLKALTMYVAQDESVDMSDKTIFAIYDLLDNGTIEQLDARFNKLPDAHLARMQWVCFASSGDEEEQQSTVTRLKERFQNCFDKMAQFYDEVA